jgi:two-component system chemotaxis response regulator CheB
MANPIDQIAHTMAPDEQAQARDQRPGMESFYICPECGGSLGQLDSEHDFRFRCHVGHIYYREQLLEKQNDDLEAALWTAVRTFKERATLAHQMASREREKGQTASADRFVEQAYVAERYGMLIQDHIRKGMPEPPSTPDEPA